jgi:hypothetical protein
MIDVLRRRRYGAPPASLREGVSFGRLGAQLVPGPTRRGSRAGEAPAVRAERDEGERDADAVPQDAVVRVHRPCDGRDAHDGTESVGRDLAR